MGEFRRLGGGIPRAWWWNSDGLVGNSEGLVGNSDDLLGELRRLHGRNPHRREKVRLGEYSAYAPSVCIKNIMTFVRRGAST